MEIPLLEESTPIWVQDQGDVLNLHGIVQIEFVPINTIVNSKHYNVLLKLLKDDMFRKQPEKWVNGFIPQHNNSSYHASFLLQ